MEKIELKAYGKINLGLDVIRKRPDGYHDLDMIMQMVDIFPVRSRVAGDLFPIFFGVLLPASSYFLVS